MSRSTPPPSNNMGAQITVLPSSKMGCLLTKEVKKPLKKVEKPLQNEALVDWFAFTLPLVRCPDEAVKISHLDCFDFQPCDFGGMGYKKSLRAGNVVVFYDGAENMGVHISMTGQGCRQYESIKGTKNCWEQLFLSLHNLNHITPDTVKFKRLDVAIDNVDGQLCLDALESSIRANEVRSIFKGGKLIEKLAFTDEKKNHGKTIYVGSDTSRLKARFYDKAAQLQIDGHWVRAEIQFMAERAEKAILAYIKRTVLGEIVTKTLNQYFTLIERDDSNISRCTVKPWWAAWLGTTEKLKLTTRKADKYVSEVVDHIKKQFAPSFAMMRKFYGVVDFHEIIRDLVESGKERMSKKHEQIIAMSQLDMEIDEFCTDLPF
ncbi:MAG: replication initiation factor domain-containing protein [Desulfuromonadaceae bacterium]